MSHRATAAMITLGLITLGLISLTACSGSAHQPAQPASAPRSTAELAKSYLAIAEPANHVLDTSFDALEDHDDDVAASATLLQTIAATERTFDRDLLALRLPPPMDAVVAQLIRVNEQRADITTHAAMADTVDGLARDEIDLKAMNVPVEAQVTALRTQLGLPPPSTS